MERTNQDELKFGESPEIPCAAKRSSSSVVLAKLGMSKETLRRLRNDFGLGFRNFRGVNFYNLEEVAKTYLECPTKWKLERTVNACERYLANLNKSRAYFKKWKDRPSVESVDDVVNENESMAQELDEVCENWERRNRELERLSAANAELARENAEMREEIAGLRARVPAAVENKYAAAPETDEAGVVKGCDVPLFFSAASAIALCALIVAAIYAAAM